LPETFAKQDAAGINCLLLTQRLTVKCQIAKRFVDEINGSHDNAVEQEMSISLKQKLSLLSSLSVRLTAFIQRASVANFIRLGDALPALTPLEAR
jgi:hypothetical protein